MQFFWCVFSFAARQVDTAVQKAKLRLKIGGGWRGEEGRKLRFSFRAAKLKTARMFSIIIKRSDKNIVATGKLQKLNPGVAIFRK